MKNKIWIQSSQDFKVADLGINHRELPIGIYLLKIDPFGQFYLTYLFEKFAFDYKVYGVQTKFVERVSKFSNTSSENLGILLNGTKGTGKTVTAKLIANDLNMPVIIVDTEYENFQNYFNGLDQDICIFIDEYEKIFGESNDLLTIMDGVLNSEHKRSFILTTNTIYISESLLQRPSRIRYLKTFKDLDKDTIIEIVKDCLIYPELAEDVIRFISTLEVVTMDIVKQICIEVNTFKESPEEFSDVFNVKKNNSKVNAYLLDENGEKIDPVPFLANVPYNQKDLHQGGSFYINKEYFGEILETQGDYLVDVQINTCDNRISTRRAIAVLKEHNLVDEDKYCWNRGEDIGDKETTLMVKILLVPQDVYRYSLVY